MFRAVLPVIDRETTWPCIESMGPRLRERLLIVDNSPDGFAATWDLLGGTRVFRPPINYGVGRAWNLAIREALDAGDRWVVLMTAGIRFGVPGGDDLVDLLDRYDGQGFITDPTNWRCAAWRTSVFAEIGVFDEHFYPGYFEDTDLVRRVALAGMPWGRLPVAVSHPGPDGHGVERLRQTAPGHSTVSFEALTSYYTEKWGGPPNEETFVRPFGDKPLWWWEPVSVETLVERYGLAFTRHPDV